MLIRCTHCHHELRVPEHQISPSGTRVLCRSCNTIFIARRPTDEGRGTQPKSSNPEVLAIAEDPALEAALDRVLDRTPMPGTLGSSPAAGDHGDAGSSVTPGFESDSEPPPASAMPSWGASSPEDLGISLVEDDGAPSPAPARTSQPEPGRARAGARSDTGSDDVDHLLDQVLRDLDGSSPQLSVQPDSALPADDSDELLAGLGLSASQPSSSQRGLRDAATQRVSSQPPAPSPTTTASGLDLEAILSEMEDDAPDEPESRDDRRLNSAFDDEAVTMAIGLADDAPAKTSTSRRPAPTASPDEDTAHEREQSLEEIYAGGRDAPLTDEIDTPPAAPATDLVHGSGHGSTNEGTQLDALRRGPAAPRPSEVRPRKAAPEPRRRRAPPTAASLLLAALVLAAVGAGLWMWNQERLDSLAAAANSSPKGLPTFGFEEQDGEIVRLKGSLAFVVHGKVRNTSEFPVYIVKVSGVLRTADGRDVGRTSSYAGNQVTSASLTKVARAEVQSTLDTRIGEGGNNVKVDPGAALPFTLVFYDVPSDASVPELTASARTFAAAPATAD